MSIDKVVTFLSRFIPYPELREKHVFAEWKNKILVIMLGVFTLIGPVAIIPGIAISISHGVWGMAIADLLIYVCILFVTFSKKLNSDIKAILCFSIFYMLALATFINIGPIGEGFNYLFIFVLLSCFFYGYKGMFYASALSIVSLALLYFPIYFDLPLAKEMSNYGKTGWLVNCAIFMTTSLFFSVLLIELQNYLNRTLNAEKKTAELLKTNQIVLEEQRKKAQESDRLKSQFLANMSHEIRTPMNALLGFSEMLGDPDLEADAIKEFNEIIRVSGDQLMRIIDDIIDISKIESDQMKIELGVVNVNSALCEVIELSRNRVKVLNKDLDIQLQTSNVAEIPLIETDLVRFKQILINLLDNAIKYSNSGTIEVGCSIEDKLLEFYVKDEGKGIPENEQNAIFNRFSQASNIQFKEGTGLGLSIVHGLLHLLGGRIWLKSKENFGSTFYFTLPCNLAKKMQPKDNTKKHEFEIPDFSGKVIFVAEDDENSYLLIKQILKNSRVVLKHAIHGKELLDYLEQEQPDLILLDINMPVLNGFETMELLREKYPDLPVIAQTAYAMADERKKCFQYGCNDYLAKPIKKESLYKTIQPFLS